MSSSRLLMMNDDGVCRQVGRIVDEQTCIATDFGNVKNAGWYFSRALLCATSRCPQCAARRMAKRHRWEQFDLLRPRGLCRRIFGFVQVRFFSVSHPNLQIEASRFPSAHPSKVQVFKQAAYARSNQKNMSM